MRATTGTGTGTPTDPDGSTADGAGDSALLAAGATAAETVSGGVVVAIEDEQHGQAWEVQLVAEDWVNASP